MLLCSFFPCSLDADWTTENTSVGHHVPKPSRTKEWFRPIYVDSVIEMWRTMCVTWAIKSRRVCFPPLSGESIPLTACHYTLVPRLRDFNVFSAELGFLGFKLPPIYEQQFVLVNVTRLFGYCFTAWKVNVVCIESFPLQKHVLVNLPYLYIHWQI